MAEHIDLNDGWEFTPTISDAFLAGETCDATEVRLPHTCAETPLDYFDNSVYEMVCGYRRTIHAPATWTSRSVALTIGAAGHTATVFLNGRPIREHRCGYTAFSVELAPFLLLGEDNLLVIRVDTREQQNVPPFGHVIDYLTYGGLYREVCLDVRPAVHLADVFARPSLPASGLLAEDTPERDVAATLSALDLSGELAVEVTLADVSGEKPDDSGLELRATLRDGDGATVATCRQSLSGCPTLVRSALERRDEAFVLHLDVPHASAWDVDRPYLYALEVELARDGVAVDARTTRLGFRHEDFRADGLYLNGRRLSVVGLNRHQSWPYVGYAMPRSQQRLDADILKYELGVNAVRTSHYPQSQHFVDRCDEIGLLVFTEIPGWQHIGDEAWRRQAIRNVEEMVVQYRNHPSVFLWGVRINESADDDELYASTNAAAHALDPTRPTGGVRCITGSHLLEDVYTYNDFVHDGKAPGCRRRSTVTPDPSKPYLITEHDGHMWPTKTYDCEDHRTEQLLRHARVLDAVACGSGIAGSFGWCMFDYNTHGDFGSGDRVCHHGVLDMFRNPKLAAAVYAAHQETTPVLEVSSTMDIGEHPGGIMGDVYAVTNADSVRMYRNGLLVREFDRTESPFGHLEHGPIAIDDFVGDALERCEGFSHGKAEAVKAVLNHVARFGSGNLSASVVASAAKALAVYRMSVGDAFGLYERYVGGWGGDVPVYRFDAMRSGLVVASVTRAPVTSVHLEARADHTTLVDGPTYDVASVRLSARDQNGNVLPYCMDAVTVSVRGPVEVIGPQVVVLRGGLGGTYVRTTGETGEASLTLTPGRGEPVTIPLVIEAWKRGQVIGKVDRL